MLRSNGSVKYYEGCLAVCGAVLSSAAHEELRDCTTLVLGHAHGSSLEGIGALADSFPNGVGVREEMDDLHLIRNVAGGKLGHKAGLDHLFSLLHS